MNKSSFYIFSFMLCAVCGRVGAQTLTLDECVNKALEHNRSLSSAKLKLEQTRFDSKVYKANFFPQFNLMAIDFYSTAKGDFTINGAALEEPVWIDLVTGAIYRIPDRMMIGQQGHKGKGKLFEDVPYYDAPAVITDKSLVMKEK